MPDVQKTTAARWRWRNDEFASFDIGRVQLAQLCYGAASGYWSWTLFHTVPGERQTYSSQDKTEAMAVVEAHAKKVLTDAE